MIKIVIGFVAVLLSAQIVSAHTGGFTYETTKDEYFIDIGASNTEFIPGKLNLFEYNLYKVTDPNNLADFDSVYVTISDAQALRFSSFIHRPNVNSLTTLSYDFPAPGQYEMSARFQKAGESMVEVTFPLQVQSNGLNPNVLKIGILFGILGLALGYGVAKYKHTSGGQVNS